VRGMSASCTTCERCGADNGCDRRVGDAYPVVLCWACVCEIASESVELAVIS